MSRITLAPEAAPLWRKGYPYRMRVLRRFPFVVFYVVDEAEIEVVAIAHAKRRPGYWLKRVQAF